MIDPAVEMESTTKAKMAKFKKYNEWLKTHSRQRQIYVSAEEMQKRKSNCSASIRRN